MTRVESKSEKGIDQIQRRLVDVPRFRPLEDAEGEEAAYSDIQDRIRQGCLLRPRTLDELVRPSIQDIRRMLVLVEEDVREGVKNELPHWDEDINRIVIDI